MKQLAGRAQKVNTDVIGLDVRKDVVAYSHLDAVGDEIHAVTLASGGPPW